MPDQKNTIQNKGLTILGDQMQQEYLACKKAEFYASTFSDAQMKAVADQLARDHRDRFNRLYSYLNSHT